MRTIDKIITQLDCRYGAPMGRASKLPQHYSSTIIEGRKHILIENRGVEIYPTIKLHKLFDCKVPIPDGCYDKGGAYWGHGAELRVSYTKDLSYVHFYRLGDE
jgi:hypothetical protein